MVPWSPEIAIGASIQSGHCWSFTGSTGYLGMALAEAVVVTNITVKHIPAELTHNWMLHPRTSSCGDLLKIMPWWKPIGHALPTLPLHQCCFWCRRQSYPNQCHLPISSQSRHLHTTCIQNIFNKSSLRWNKHTKFDCQRERWLCMYKLIGGMKREHACIASASMEPVALCDM